MKRLLTCAFVMAATLLACGGSAERAPAGTGVEGTVTIGPQCPVVRVGEPCPDRPLAAGIVIKDRDGREVLRVRSGEDGTFRADLFPGRYTLVPEQPNPGAPPHASPVEVTVREGAYTPVRIQFDSGIR